MNLASADRVNLCSKRIFDVIVSVLLLIVLMPLLLLIVVTIKLASKGPAIFRQERFGQDEQVFILYKFRTMCLNAEDLLPELQLQNESQGPVFKIQHDPRIIPFIGTLLRKTNLDELPQLFNVLRGDMSLVGPRPHEAFVVEKYMDWQKRRLYVKPGMTCEWQIQPKRNGISFDEWMQMDLAYIDQWSLWLDLKILMSTALLMFRRK